ncbi:nitrile hydratase accessory protein [bacterium]|nr:nitrile hydratase accessory protein [bacterium]
MTSAPEVSAPSTDRVFREPWEARAFAMTLALHERGLFTWSEWAAALSARLHDPHADPSGADYYHHWVEALGDLLASKGVDQGGSTGGSQPHSTTEIARADPRTAREGRS